MAQCRVEADAVKSTLELSQPRKPRGWIYLTTEHVPSGYDYSLTDIAVEGSPTTVD